MKKSFDTHSIDSQIRLIRKAAEKLNAIGDDFPSISKNAARILASVSMMELSLPDFEDGFEAADTGPAD